MRLGIFGGSFDPVHRGHVELARAARTQAALDELWLVPTAQQPLKPTGPQTSGTDRLAMLRLAFADEPGCVASDIELARGGVSYTVDTLQEVQRRRPEAALYFILGADSLRDLPRWREAETIRRLATLVVVERAGETPLTPAEMAGCLRITMPATPVASRDIRRRVAAGEPIRELVAPAVADYIAAYRLYTEVSQ